MTYQDLDPRFASARQRLINTSGTPFAPSADVKPVVDVMDGRKTNDAIEPKAWRRALEAADGGVAVKFWLAADHEWWLAYDLGSEYPGNLNGPFHRWTTYPSGPWDHTMLPSGILDSNLEDVYWEHDREDRCDIYRSCVIAIEDAPEFVRREVSDRV